MEYPPLVPMPERMQETFDWFREMRASHPVYYDAETNTWHLLRQQDVRSALANYQQFSSELAPGSDFSDAISLVFMDPPRHDELRALIAQAFTPRSIAQLAPTIRERVDHLLEPVRAKGQMDFIHDFAYPLPAIVIADLLGVPVEDQDLLKGWADAFLENGFASLTNRLDNPEKAQKTRRALQEMSHYFAKLLEERRRQPREDLISRLLVAEHEGKFLSEDELIKFCYTLVGAGHETTTNLFGNALVCLDLSPESFQRLGRSRTD